MNCRSMNCRSTQMLLLLDVVFLALFKQWLGLQHDKILSATDLLFFSLILNIRLNKIPTH